MKSSAICNRPSARRNCAPFRRHFVPGDEVEIAEGAMRGLRAIVTRVLPGRERIAVLMEFLGRQTMVELPRHCLIKDGNERLALFTGGSTP